MISLRGVRKAYSSETSIGPVDLDIPAGGITALVGPNGAGKSTLLTMIGRLMGMDDGQIEIAGFDVTSTKSRCLLYTSPSPRDRTRSRMPSSA